MFEDRKIKFAFIPKSDEDSEEDGEEMVEVRVDEEKEYTEHTAIAEFTDGTSEEYTFDSMNERDNAIVLKNYTAYNPNANMFGPGGFVGEAFVTIPYHNLKSFETTERTTETMEYEITKKVPESEIED